ncbi:MAG: hypothetical protein OEW39_15500, partial [Deltaproteobacteria bacterium]|nr:hypothetical protein [Deltaproteobacteria bacterium]
VQNSGAGSATASNTVRVLGPEPAPIKRLAGRYRFMVLLRAPSVRPLHRLLSWALDHPAVKGGARSRIAVDVDPYDLL